MAVWLRQSFANVSAVCGSVLHSFHGLLPSATLPSKFIHIDLTWVIKIVLLVPLSCFNKLSGSGRHMLVYIFKRFESNLNLSSGDTARKL